MAKKSLLPTLILSLVILGVAGAFVVRGGVPVQAAVAISQEVGGGTNSTSGSQGGEGSFQTSAGQVAISPEVGDQTTIGQSGNGDEGSFDTLPNDNGGGGGGGGSSGGGRRRTVTEAPTTCVYPYLTNYIKWGAANDPAEVLKLQRFLRDFQHFDVPLSGQYDEATLTAVMSFQRQYARDVLEPWGLSADQPTGFVFITTTLVINRLYCQMSTAHDLDLRHVYDEASQPAPSNKEGSAASYRAEPVPVVPALVVATSAAATCSPWWSNLLLWLNLVLLLIILILAYLLWRERYWRRRDGDYDDAWFDGQPVDEVQISPEDEADL